MRGKRHAVAPAFELLFSFSNYTPSSHSSLRSLILHQIVTICKCTSACSSPSFSSFDWRLFEGLNCVSNLLFLNNHHQLSCRSLLSLSFCSQLTHLLSTHKAVLLCHLASLSSFNPKQNAGFRRCRSAPLGSLPDFCWKVLYLIRTPNTNCVHSLPYQASLLAPAIALCLFHGPQVRDFLSKLLVAYCAVKGYGFSRRGTGVYDIFLAADFFRSSVLHTYTHFLFGATLWEYLKLCVQFLKDLNGRSTKVQHL